MSIDSRILSMRFDNKQFMDAVGATLGVLQKLKSNANLSEAQGAADKFNLNQMTGAIEGVSGRFLAMSTVAITALANITNRAINAGMAFSKAFTIEPIQQGFGEFELKMGSIQTIMAGSGASLDVVNEKLGELNTYSDKTIYSFADMTQNIGKFTNAGVDLDTAVDSIQGIANVAAISGANSNEASRAMYNFSQALSKGYVQLIDWKSIELANMGTVEFKTQLLDAAVAAGTLTKKGEEYITSSGMAVTATKNFNDSLTDQWMTTETLTSTLSAYTDETTEIGKKAIAAATEVKTFSMLIDTIKEAIGSGWAQTFEYIIGDFDEGKQLWTDINNVIGDMVGNQADARNEVLRIWKALGGRTDLIKSLSNIWSALSSVLGTVKEAFEQVFPPITGVQLKELTRSFKEFTERLKPSESTLEKLKNIFVGVFSAISLGVKVVKAIVGAFSQLFGVIFDGSGGGLLDLAETIANFVTELDKGKPKIDFMSKAMDKLLIAVNFLKEGFSKLWDYVGPALGKFADFAGVAIDRIADGFANINWDTIFTGVGTGAFAGIAAALLVFSKNGLKLDFGGGILETLKDTAESLGGVFKSVEQSLKADAIKNIAISVAILAGAFLILSMIDPQKLGIAAAGVASALTMLLASMNTIAKITGTDGYTKIPILAAAMVALSGSILILAVAMKIISTMTWDELGRGLVGVAIGMFILVQAADAITRNTKGIFKAAISIQVLAVAMLLMAAAIKVMSMMSWVELGKGIGAIAVSLALIALAMKLMPGGAKMVGVAVGMTILGSAMLILAQAIKTLGGMDLKSIGKGLGTMAASLALIGLSMKLMPNGKKALAQAAALLIVAGAITLLSDALTSLGGMTWEQIVKGLVGLAGALVIIGIALNLMSGTIGGSAALIIASAAIAMLVPPLIALGQLSWGEILTGLAALALALLVIGGAAALFGLGAPLLLLGAAALLAFGVGLLAVAAAAFLFATAFALIATAASVGGAVLREALLGVAEAIPSIIEAIGLGIIAFIQVLVDSQETLVEGFAAVLGALIQAGIELVPQFGELFRTILAEIITTVEEAVPDIVDLGWTIIMAVVDGIEENLPDLIESAGNIAVEFINGVSDKHDDILDAGTDALIKFIDGLGSNSIEIVNAAGETILKFINGLTAAVNRYMPRIRIAGRQLAFAIADGMTGGLGSKIGSVASKARELAGHAISAIKARLDSNSPSKETYKLGVYAGQGLENALGDARRPVSKAAASVGTTVVSTLRNSMDHISDIVNADFDMSPRITPVVDLTDVQQSAALANKIFDTSSIRATTSTNAANSIALTTQQTAADVASSTNVEPSVKFEQNITSPKAISEIDVYRGTKNLLSMAKEELTKS